MISNLVKLVIEINHHNTPSLLLTIAFFSQTVATTNLPSAFVDLPALHTAHEWYHTKPVLEHSVRNVCSFHSFPFKLLRYSFVLTEKCRGLLLQGINYEMRVRTMPEHFQSTWRVSWLASMSFCHSLRSLN